MVTLRRENCHSYFGDSQRWPIRLLISCWFLDVHVQVKLFSDPSKKCGDVVKFALCCGNCFFWNLNFSGPPIWKTKHFHGAALARKIWGGLETLGPLPRQSCVSKAITKIWGSNFGGLLAKRHEIPNWRARNNPTRLFRPGLKSENVRLLILDSERRQGLKCLYLEPFEILWTCPTWNYQSHFNSFALSEIMAGDASNNFPHVFRLFQDWKSSFLAIQQLPLWKCQQNQQSKAFWGQWKASEDHLRLRLDQIEACPRNWSNWTSTRNGDVSVENRGNTSLLKALKS